MALLDVEARCEWRSLVLVLVGACCSLAAAEPAKKLDGAASAGDELAIADSHRHRVQHLEPHFAHSIFHNAQPLNPLLRTTAPPKQQRAEPIASGRSESKGEAQRGKFFVVVRCCRAFRSWYTNFTIKFGLV